MTTRGYAMVSNRECTRMNTNTHPHHHALPAVVIAKLAAISRDNQTELEDVLIKLGKSVPLFAARILEDMAQPGGSLANLKSRPPSRRPPPQRKASIRFLL